MNSFSRALIFFTFFGCCFGLVLIAAALGTEFWFIAKCLQRDLNSNHTFISNAYGNVHFGLFRGIKTLNWGIGDRVEVLNVKSSLVPYIVNEGLWISTISTLAAALLFSVVAAISAVVNAASSPSVYITGVPGLYLWNILSGSFGLASMVCWGVQFALNLRSNVLLEEAEDGWTTEGFQSLGYSYWLLAVAVAIHVGNCVVIRIGAKEKTLETRYEVPDSKAGNMMLY